MKNLSAWVTTWMLMAALGSLCALIKPPFDKTLSPAPVDTLALHGITDASWYGRYFHGRTTRYGERYDMDGLTCACNRLPYNTRLLVTNMANNKSVVVRVNDTGAFKKVYLDLSRAAFAAIADTNTGIITVEVRIIN